MSKPAHHVALAIVIRDEHCLVARRPAAAHLGGLWEFPGGKCEPLESAATAALRELWEECAVRAATERVFPTITVEYPDRVVHLTPVTCRWLAGEPQPIGNDACRWVPLSELNNLKMPAVNAQIIAALRPAVAADNTPAEASSPGT